VKKVGKDVVPKKKKMTATMTYKLLGITAKTGENLKAEFKEAKKFKRGDDVKITSGKYAVGKKGVVVGHTMARETKKSAPHVFVIVAVEGQGVLKYPKNLKKLSPTYIS
jgi:transcription antitermination factor NusG